MRCTIRNKLDPALGCLQIEGNAYCLQVLHVKSLLQATYRNNTAVIIFAMNILLRSSRCLLRHITSTGPQIPSEIAEGCTARSAEAAALLTYCRHRSSSAVMSSPCQRPVRVAGLSFSMRL